MANARAGISRYRDRDLLRQDLRDVVVDHENHDDHQEHEADLDHGFLLPQIEIAAQEHFDQQQQDHAAVEDRDGEQIEDREVQADSGHQLEKRCSAFARGVAGELGDADRTFDRFRRHAPLDDSLEESSDELRKLNVAADRFVKGLMKRQLGDLDVLLERDTDHPAFLTVKILLDRRDHDAVLLTVARVDQIDSTSVGVSQHLMQARSGTDRLSVDADQDVAFPQSGVFRGVDAGNITCYLHVGLLHPAEETDAVLLVEDRRDFEVQAFAVADHPNIYGLAGAGDFFQNDIFPVGIHRVVELDNLIAFANPGLGRGAIGNHVADDRILGGRNMRVMLHEKAGEQHYGEHDVDGRAGERNDQPLPARFRQQTSGIGIVFVAGLVPGHFDVAAEQDCREPEIGFAAAEAEQPRAEPEAEGFDFHVEQTRGQVVAQLVDQDHNPNQHQVPPDIL